MALELNIKSRSKNRRRTITREHKAGQVFLTVLTLALIAIGGFLYLSQANQVAIKGFEIKELEKEVEKQQEISHDLKLKSTELESLRNLKEKVKTLNFVPTEQVQYVAGADVKRDVALNE